MVELHNVYQFCVGIDNMSATSYCDVCDETIYYGHSAYVIEDESEFSFTCCSECFVKVSELYFEN